MYAQPVLWNIMKIVFILSHLFNASLMTNSLTVVAKVFCLFCFSNILLFFCNTCE